MKGKPSCRIFFFATVKPQIQKKFVLMVTMMSDFGERGQKQFLNWADILKQENPKSYLLQ
ncbi:MAG: hypothetical protein CM1200mP16_15660 [Nitrospina sp.]|nr:MAG: hypothetical protein CM1200mP16_15660 [Nitrospina sp.]